MSEWDATHPDPENRRGDWTRQFVHHYKLAVLSSAAIGWVPDDLDAMAERAADEAWGKHPFLGAKRSGQFKIKDPRPIARASGDKDAALMHPVICLPLLF